MNAVDKEAYLADPCGASSLPYWKAGRFSVPAGMLVLRDDEFKKGEFPEYDDAPFFKLVHRMEGIEKPGLPDGFHEVKAGFAELAAHIKSCYGGGPDSSELAAYAERPTYDPSLWTALADADGGIAASGIAEYDGGIGEGVLEWVQVSNEYRRRGLGEYIVRELLYRLRGRARFVTVSGELNSPWEPLRLYEKCGFGGTAVWHVLKEKMPWT